MVEQCICNRLQAQEILHEWVAYSATKQGVKLTTDTLEQFEHEVTGPQIFNMHYKLLIKYATT